MPEDVGPVLVEGPVEVVLPDGSVESSERPVVALCTCRRSRRYPYCDTSHRRHGRPRAGASADGEASAGGEASADGEAGQRGEK
jgi:CDGSH-type Zn-finger protein